MAGTHPTAGTHRGTAGGGCCPDLPARRVGSGNAAGSAAAGIPRQGCGVWAGSHRDKLVRGQHPPGPGLGDPQDKEPPASSIPRAAGMRRAQAPAAKRPDSSQGAPHIPPFQALLGFASVGVFRCTLAASSSSHRSPPSPNPPPVEGCWARTVMFSSTSFAPQLFND